MRSPAAAMRRRRALFRSGMQKSMCVLRCRLLPQACTLGDISLTPMCLTLPACTSACRPSNFSSSQAWICSFAELTTLQRRVWSDACI